jgi:hypothetical protein
MREIINTLRDRSGRTAVVVLAAVGLVSVASGAIAGAFTHGTHATAHPYRSAFAVFSRHSRARTAAVTGSATHIPANAALAGSSRADGQINEIYAWERSQGEYCLLDVEAVTARSVVCGSRTAAEEHGLLLAENSVEYLGTNVVVLVPNGVRDVTFTEDDGAAHTVAVTNNFAAYASSGGVSSVRFTMPDGVREETRVGLQAHS